MPFHYIGHIFAKTLIQLKKKHSVKPHFLCMSPIRFLNFQTRREGDSKIVMSLNAPPAQGEELRGGKEQCQAVKQQGSMFKGELAVL